MKFSYSAFALLIGTTAFAVAPGTNSDVNDSIFSFVGQLNGASAVLVGPDLVLTAKHVGPNVGDTFTLPGSGSYAITAVIPNPDTDITLFRIGSSLSNWAKVTTTDANQKAVKMVGFGYSGSLNSTGTGYDLNVGNGVRRVANGFVEGYADVSFTDQPPFFTSIYSPLRKNGDGALASGDSGGGWFIQEDGEYHLVGTNSYIGTFSNPGTTPTTGNYQFSSKADDFFASGAANLNTQKDWLTRNGVQVVPEPASMIALSLGLVALLKRRKS